MLYKIINDIENYRRGAIIMEIMTRRQAADIGLSKYSTGKPCAKGHDSPRYTASGNCIKCATKRGKFYSDRMKMARFGSDYPSMVEFKATIHADDLPAVQQLVDALEAYRKSGRPV